MSRIDDAGAVIAGARKFGSNRTLTLDDLAEMSQAEAATLITKDHVWPKPDYQALVDDGMAPEAAALVKIIRDRMAAKPRFNIYQLGTRVLRDPLKVSRDFVSMTSAARDVLMNVRSSDEARQATLGIYNHIGWSPGDRDPERQHLLFSIYKGRRSPLHLDNIDLSKAKRMIAEGFPGDVPAWRKGVSVFKTRDGLHYLRKGGKILGRDFTTQEEALAWLQENNQKAPARRRNNLAKPERPHLNKVARTGGEDYRNGRDVSDGEEFIETFGFRGVQFGEWLPGDERQAVLNHAYDALMDLARVLDFAPQDLSLGGNLAIAFGARGRGKAAAHYEPGQRVLNLTRLSGAGALAHEFAHAFDHWSGNPDENQSHPPHPGGIPSGSGWQMLHLDRAKYLTNLSDQQARSWADLIKKLYHAPAQNHSERTGSTGYARQAMKLSGNARGYWVHPTEMFARAFEAYVHDELTRHGVESPYLVHGVEEDRYQDGYRGNPYPVGEERSGFNDEIRTLVNEMRPQLEAVRRQDKDAQMSLSM